jgi:small-conductance mechanosensitive channel
MLMFLLSQVSPGPSAAAAGAPMDLLDTRVLSNSVREWIVAGVTLVVLLLAVWIARGVLANRLQKWAERTRYKWDDTLVQILRGIRLWLIFPALVFAAAGTLSMPEWVHRALGIVAMLGVAVQLLISSSAIVDAALAAVLARSKNNNSNGEPDPTLASSVGLLRVAIMFVLFVVVLLMGLDNLGFKITPLLTGLGIGGIAIALAVQSVLGDVFGSLTILLDKPFVVGDFIVVGQQMGTVEKIGLKTTRLRSLSGEQLVFANTDLLGSRVQNFKRMQERRVLFGFGVTYETPTNLLREVPGVVRRAIENRNPGVEGAGAGGAAAGAGGSGAAGERGGKAMVRFDRCHFKGFGAYSLDFEVVYFMLTPDFNRFMDVQHAINLDLMEAFAAMGVAFAYPTSVEIVRGEDTKPVRSEISSR